MVARPGVHDPGRRLLATRITIGLRALFGYDPLLDGEAVLRVALLAAPLFFLVGLGCFDYWFYWAAGRPTRPEDHSGHGAYSWKDYFRAEHRPQGDRHPVRRHLVLLPLRGRAAGDAHARRARRAGPPVRRRQHLQRPLQRPRLAADLPVRHPGLRGAGELRAAADDRRAGHGLPAPERAVVLAAAGRRHDDAAVLPGARRVVRQRLDGLRAAEHLGADRAGVLHHRACSSRARRRSPRR